jgi:hypothetical protein
VPIVKIKLFFYRIFLVLYRDISIPIFFILISSLILKYGFGPYPGEAMAANIMIFFGNFLYYALKNEAAILRILLNL